MPPPIPIQAPLREALASGDAATVPDATKGTRTLTVPSVETTNSPTVSPLRTGARTGLETILVRTCGKGNRESYGSRSIAAVSTPTSADLPPETGIDPTRSPADSSFLEGKRRNPHSMSGMVSWQADDFAPRITAMSRRPPRVAEPTKQCPAGRV